MVRGLLFEAAKVLLSRSTRPSALKTWGEALSKRIGANPDISHSLSAVDQFCGRFSRFVNDRATPWRRETRAGWDFSGLRGQRRSDLGGPEDGAGLVARRGGACQAGEPRALAAALRRMAASPQTTAVGQPEAMAILMRRTLVRTSAPIFMNLRRMVPQLALSKRV
jgi:hypothetical protein